MNPDQPQFEKYWRERIALESKMQTESIDFYDWVKYGVDRGWSTDVFCETHDGPEMTDEEAKEWEQGLDPCFPIIRIW